MAYPTTIDSFTPVAGTTTLVAVDHADFHNRLGTAVVAIENKLGFGSGSAAANQILVGSGAGTAAWGATANGLTLGSTTLGTPTITLGSDAQGDVFYRSSGGTLTRLAPGTSGQFLQTQGASANPLWATATNSDPILADAHNARTTNHITITPGVSKLVKIAVLEQDNTGTNTYRNNSIILTGWATPTTPGSPTTFISTTVTFGITFTTTPMVLVSATGGRGVSADLTTVFTEDVSACGGAIGTGSFVLTIIQGHNATLSASVKYPACWIAIGTL